MAAIDKLYIKDYSDFLTLRIWVLRYYPKLMSKFYDFFCTGAEFHSEKDRVAKRNLDTAKSEYERVFGDPLLNHDIDFAIENLQKQYKDGVGYDCSYEQARDEVEYIKKCYEKSYDELYEDASIAVMNTSLSEDRRLKWTCPITVVREYLQNQCGVKKNREWLYRLFWRGKRLVIP